MLSKKATPKIIKEGNKTSQLVIKHQNTPKIIKCERGDVDGKGDNVSEESCVYIGGRMADDGDDVREESCVCVAAWEGGESRRV
ncbi:hypothetical protein Pint_10783 [Pistacia integerrima]|uniref:Uncharacterized protein n=1 Tax=Pistacia integerrima TaxID=434235 RepID=A0ACC0XFH2_9ROSI|nr:hypothetical protein Pint_10783 [Pistacia integerrima]